MPPRLAPAAHELLPMVALPPKFDEMCDKVEAIYGKVTETSEDIKTVRAVVAGGPPDDADAPRPPEPTAYWCLRGTNSVRWAGESPIDIPSRLWHLLRSLLQQAKWPVSIEVVESSLGKEYSSKTFSNEIGRLNELLEPIEWPWIYSTKSGRVYRD